MPSPIFSAEAPPVLAPAPAPGTRLLAPVEERNAPGALRAAATDETALAAAPWKAAS
jgi:hypothetical protein